MIDFLIRWSLGNRLLVLAVAGALLIGGSWMASRTSVDVFPDLTAPVVTLVAEAKGMPPEDVERLVTLPLETALNGASGVRRLRSNTGVGIVVISVEFDWGTDIYQARQIVSEKLQLARASLPPDLPPPALAPVSSIMGEIMFIALVSDRHEDMELKTLADWTLRRRLLAVPGVAEVIPIGGETRQFQIVASSERLSAYGVSLNHLLEAVRDSNANAAAGFVSENNQEYLIQGLGRIETLEDIGEILVSTREGVPVLVRDLADISVGPAPRRGTAAYNGKSAVVMGIQKQPQANTLALTQTLDTVIANLAQGLPEGMRIETNAFRQADFIGNAIDNLLAAVRDGAVLVIAIMFIFLVSARATGIALMAIPLSVLVSILVIRWFGGTLNTMTLGGIAIAMGALVDDAIIVVENIVRRLRQNLSLPHAERQATLAIVLQATREIQSSILFATLIIVLVFIPLFFLSGIEGRLLQPLGLAYIISLAASLLVALTVTPVLCLYLLPGSKPVHQPQESRLILWLKARYRPLLESTLTHAGRVISGAAAILVIALLTLVFAGRSFLPEFNEGSLTLSVVTLPGTALETSDKIGARVESILLEQPEVIATARRTGRAELDPHAQEVFASEIDVTLAMQARSKDVLLASLRERFADIPGTNVIIGQPISHRIDHMLSGTRANIAVKIFGEDLFELRRLGQQIENLVREVPGAVDVAMEEQSEIPFVSVKFNRLALATYGLSMAQAAQLLETAFTGTVASRIMEGDASFDLIVRLPERTKSSVEALKETLVTLPSGAIVSLSALASIEKRRGPNAISRENVQRKLVVMANVSDRALVTVVEEIQNAVAKNIQLPPGYYIDYGGQFESARAAGSRLLWLGAAVILGTFLLLVTAFGSARDASLIMLNLPLALIGGVAGVWLIGGTISIAAVIGFITLFGIATRNGIILIDHIQRLIRDHGMAPPAAIRRGAEERLIPILMTALGTALALVPLALAAGEPGSEIQAPMAVVILFGLLTSTALNMLVVPAMYLRFGQLSRSAVA